MKTITNLFCIGLVALSSISCGIGELEDRIDALENALGTNEPTTIKIETKDYNDDPVIYNQTFKFKSIGNSNAIGVIKDYDLIQVALERFIDVETSQNTELLLEYSEETKTVTFARLGINILHEAFGTYNMYFYKNGQDNTFDITLKDINTKTGQISLDITIKTDGNTYTSIYYGQPTTLKLSFKGKLKVVNDYIFGL
jgi:hypothetical protein